VLLFLDTETTGFPKDYKAPVSDVKNWPRLVQIAWLLTDVSGNEVKCAEHIIRPNGFTIPTDASRVHGITTEIAMKAGADLKLVLDAIAKDLSSATVLIAHNIRYDENILGAEFLRMGYPNHIETKPRKCTMQSSTNFCRISGPYGYKWPKLEELYGKLFREDFDDAHDALADVKACAKCYFELRRIGVMS
jgi:DNA polymerase III epsilon subunit-like protein